MLVGSEFEVTFVWSGQDVMAHMWIRRDGEVINHHDIVTLKSDIYT